MQQGEFTAIKNDLESLLGNLMESNDKEIDINDLYSHMDNMDNIDSSMDQFIDKIDDFHLKLDSLLNHVEK